MEPPTFNPNLTPSSLHSGFEQLYITLSHKRKDPKNIQPLYVIDNKISTKKIFDKLYPSEIKKIEILDGMSGAAYYGEEGRNGVFIVITKSSKK